ncbi:DUF1330 domain-containing protein [Pantoea sp. Mb-10]|uniref:DUF1330 domain-containing protein n=1 Tax=unclassified Pantoea TaxID=2630326 RepID=UPI001E40EA8F|nr:MULTISPECIES: DUF1330 domain-containing protein [unclassified Pantoea]MCE0490284.1 DUF1330 domain-containing protein [Pantoea sp. Mb-10]MCE0501415.1 DUF1330 domain-containing protein [Pantoea sp. Pb-8]
MPAYMVMIKDETLDKDELATYAQKAGAARGDHPLTPLAFYGDMEVLEGRDAEGVVLLEFPDVDAAKAWYHSPAYQEAKAHRLKGANYRVILVKGV